jgi:endogenous inhibitor of DNA gyrase (YacG/DUF329 family)
MTDQPIKLTGTWGTLDPCRFNPRMIPDKCPRCGSESCYANPGYPSASLHCCTCGLIWERWADGTTHEVRRAK